MNQEWIARCSAACLERGMTQEESDAAAAALAAAEDQRALIDVDYRPVEASAAVKIWTGSGPQS